MVSLGSNLLLVWLLLQAVGTESGRRLSWAKKPETMSDHMMVSMASPIARLTMHYCCLLSVDLSLSLKEVIRRMQVVSVDVCFTGLKMHTSPHYCPCWMAIPVPVDDQSTLAPCFAYLPCQTPRTAPYSPLWFGREVMQSNGEGFGNIWQPTHISHQQLMSLLLLATVCRPLKHDTCCKLCFACPYRTRIVLIGTAPGRSFQLLTNTTLWYVYNP